MRIRLQWVVGAGFGLVCLIYFNFFNPNANVLEFSDTNTEFNANPQFYEPHQLKSNPTSQIVEHAGVINANMMIGSDKEMPTCGEVCQYKFPEKPGLLFPSIEKKIDCQNIMTRILKTKPATEWPPPTLPPEELMAAFTQNGEMPIKRQYYFKSRYSGGVARGNKWNPEKLEALKVKYETTKDKIGGYSRQEEENLLKALKKYSVKKKRGFVIGSERPWVEFLGLYAGATHITTVEYGTINSTIKEIDTLTPSEAAELVLKKRFKFGDFAITHSSLEHSGLGRYGDPLNPYGDLEASAQVWCMLKPGGYFFLGLPVKNISYIEFNAHRVYGPERLKHMAASYEQVALVDDYGVLQPVIVLRKPKEANNAK